MKRFRTRLLYAFELGRPIEGFRVYLGRLGTFVWIR
jgi:hypothetical protein